MQKTLKYVFFNNYFTDLWSEFCIKNCSILVQDVFLER